jgi:DNA mismatch repair ATPase MutS
LIADGSNESNSASGEGTVFIRRGYDDTLDEMRDTFTGLDAILFDAAKLTLRDVRILENLSVKYVPQVGYLICINREDEHILRSREDFVFTFNQSEYSYFKSPLTEELDESVGDVRANILDRQKSLLIALEDEILASEEGNIYDIILLHNIGASL